MIGIFTRPSLAVLRMARATRSKWHLEQRPQFTHSVPFSAQ